MVSSQSNMLLLQHIALKRREEYHIYSGFAGIGFCPLFQPDFRNRQVLKLKWETI